MNVVSLHDPLPMDVTFFIGPVGAPPTIREAYQEAVEQNATGNSAPLDEILEGQINVLREISEDTNQEASTLNRTVCSLINCDIGTFPVFVSRGYMERSWTPIVTIQLDQLTGANGSPIGHLFEKRHGEVIAAMLGQAFKAEWIYTSWIYPVTSEGGAS